MKSDKSAFFCICFLSDFLNNLTLLNLVCLLFSQDLPTLWQRDKFPILRSKGRFTTCEFNNHKDKDSNTAHCSFRLYSKMRTEPCGCPEVNLESQALECFLLHKEIRSPIILGGRETGGSLRGPVPVQSVLLRG